MKYRIIPKSSHYELYINGNFYCSVDTMAEAIKELKNYVKN